MAVIAGTVAPSIFLEDHCGKRISSATLMRSGPLVVFFGLSPVTSDRFRFDLDNLERDAAVLREGGALILAVARYTEEDIRHFLRYSTISFPILNDRECLVAEAYGLCPAQPGNNRKKKKLSVVPVRACFVVSPQGMIVYGDVDAGYENDTGVAELIPIIIQAGKGGPRHRKPN